MRQAKSEQQAAKLDADFLQKLKNQTIAKGKEAEQRHAEPEPEPQPNAESHAEQSPILGSWGDFTKQLYQPRPPIEYIYKGLVAKGLPGALFAGGSAGKTWLALMQALYGAAGLPFSVFEPAKPLRTVFISAEDELRFLLPRAEAILDADPELKNRMDYIHENCHIVSLAEGERVAFLKAKNGEISRTDAFRRILDDLAGYDKLDWIGLDPLASFWGVSENEAENGEELVGCLRQITSATGASVQVCHHVSKSATMESISTSGGRGSSAIYNGVRWAFGMVRILPTISRAGKETDNPELKQLRLLSGDKKGRFVRLFCAKASHTEELANSIVFKRGNKGQLGQFNPAESLGTQAREELIDYIKRSKEHITVSQICKQDMGKRIRDHLTNNYNISKDQFKTLLDSLINDGRLGTEKVTIGKTSKMVLVVTD